jgi:hypothetical protein
MKIALCFIINYEHILNKEHIWREWIEPNKDIINVYFYYKDLRKIKSKWILEHTLPPNYIYETSYFHVIPAYLSLFQFALQHDLQNKWFCMLTDSCCPIISPKRFRYLFYKYYNNSIFSWKQAWWNPEFHKRGNLSKLPKELWLANDPWFTLTRNNVNQVIHFVKTQPTITQKICSGGLANETLFAVIMYFYKELTNKKGRVICHSTHLTDWNRMSNSTSPHLFKEANEQDIKFIEKELERNDYAMFVRKIAPEFPDEILRHYMYEHDKEKVEQLVLYEPLEIIFNRYRMVGLLLLSAIVLFYALTLIVM